MGRMSAAADNSIRAQFQPEVDEFIDDLTTFATGSYLQDEDKDLWEEPFDPAVLPDLKKLLRCSWTHSTCSATTLRATRW